MKKKTLRSLLFFIKLENAPVYHLQSGWYTTGKAYEVIQMPIIPIEPSAEFKTPDLVRAEMALPLMRAEVAPPVMEQMPPTIQRAEQVPPTMSQAHDHAPHLAVVGPEVPTSSEVPTGYDLPRCSEVPVGYELVKAVQVPTGLDRMRAHIVPPQPVAA